MRRSFLLAMVGSWVSLFMTKVFAQEKGLSIRDCTMQFSLSPFPEENLYKTAVQLANKCIPKLNVVKQCALKMDRTFSELGRISSNFSHSLYLSGVGEGSMWNRYLSIKQMTIQKQERIGVLIQEFKQVPTDEASIFKQMSSLEIRFAIEIDGLNDLFDRESQLLSAIDQLQTDLEAAGFSKDFSIKSDSGSLCDEEVTQASAKAVSIVQQMIAEPKIISDAIQKNRKTRETLIQYAFSYFHLALKIAYKNAIIGDLSTLGGKLDAVLQAKTIGAQFEAWVTYTTIEHDRNFLESVYLQYARPLNLAIQDRKTTNDFLQRMQIIGDAHPEIAAPYISRMQSIREFFGEKINRISKKGWQGFATSQKAWADRYKSSPTKVSAACVTGMSEYLNNHSNLQTFDQYQDAEAAYKKAAEICRSK